MSREEELQQQLLKTQAKLAEEKAKGINSEEKKREIVDKMKEFFEQRKEFMFKNRYYKPSSTGGITTYPTSKTCLRGVRKNEETNNN